MYSKRKIQDEPIFIYESRSRRASYRLRPLKSEPLFFTVTGKSYELIDIGSGGLSFKNTDFIAGQSGFIELKLPRFGSAINAKFEVRNICKNNICHCAFIEISEEDVEKIHQYVLETQKAMVRSKRMEQPTHMSL